jgi:hypothetical protein
MKNMATRHNNNNNNNNSIDISKIEILKTSKSILLH